MWTVADQGSTKTVTVCDSGDTSFKKKKKKEKKSLSDQSLPLSLGTSTLELSQRSLRDNMDRPMQRVTESPTDNQHQLLQVGVKSLQSSTEV
jgi:hypothetical protein